MRRTLRRALVIVAAVAALAAGPLPAPASAHSLTSSTVAVRVAEDAVAATISLPRATLEQALGTGEASAGAVAAYVEERLAVTAADGTAWPDTVTGVERETIEGIDSLTVAVQVATGDASTQRFTLRYDGIVEAVEGHEAVVVLTGSDGEISTAGVLDAGHGSLRITDGAQATPVRDMVRHGFHHVLEGPDHLLFLLALLLPAPLAAGAGRWGRPTGSLAALRRVLSVVTAFTVGHSLTLVAAALGWVTVPSAPVEVVIAVSVGVAAVHALRPLTERGGVAVALGFGLVHGLAFAGILADLGIDGGASVASLLAFNVGIELAQLTRVALVFPSLLLLSRTRLYGGVRTAGATFALAAAAGWALDRLGVLDNPLAPVEEAAVANLPAIALLLAGLAVAGWLVDELRAARGAGVVGV